MRKEEKYGSTKTCAYNCSHLSYKVHRQYCTGTIDEQQTINLQTNWDDSVYWEQTYACMHIAWISLCIAAQKKKKNSVENYFKFK